MHQVYGVYSYWFFWQRYSSYFPSVHIKYTDTFSVLLKQNPMAFIHCYAFFSQFGWNTLPDYHALPMKQNNITISEDLRLFRECFRWFRDRRQTTCFLLILAQISNKTIHWSQPLQPLALSLWWMLESVHVSCHELHGYLLHTMLYNNHIQMQWRKYKCSSQYISDL